MYSNQKMLCRKSNRTKKRLFALVNLLILISTIGANDPWAGVLQSPKPNGLWAVDPILGNVDGSSLEISEFHQRARAFLQAFLTTPDTWQDYVAPPGLQWLEDLKSDVGQGLSSAVLGPGALEPQPNGRDQRVSISLWTRESRYLAVVYLNTSADFSDGKSIWVSDLELSEVELP